MNAPTQAQSISLVAGALRVDWNQAGDRWAHQIAWRTDGAIHPLLESIEGSDQAWWPSSPPLQQLHREEDATGPRVLGVGMAGRSHWSASTVATIDPDSIRFELACRLREMSDWLGSEYRLAAGVTAAPLVDGVLLNHCGIAEARLRIVAAGIEIAEGSTAGATILRIPAISIPAKLPSTACWDYRIERA